MILFPLDTFKTRIQSKKGFWASGGFRGIYNGLPSTLVGSAPTAALFFTIYDTTKSRLDYFITKKYINPTISQIIAANLGEIVFLIYKNNYNLVFNLKCACLIRVPVDVVRQQTQVQHELNTLQIVKKIFKTDASFI